MAALLALDEAAVFGLSLSGEPEAVPGSVVSSDSLEGTFWNFLILNGSGLGFA